MNKAPLAVFLSTVLFTLSSHALSPEAEEGKSFYATCDVCHDQSNNPALGPPMWGVQRRYRRDTATPDEFINQMVSFVKAPTLEAAIHDEALGQLGLMPPMPLPDEFLRKIVTYIQEEQFPPPCDHWLMAVNNAKEKGDMEHAEKDARQLKRFCN